MGDDAAAHGYDIFIDAIMRTHRDQLAVAAISLVAMHSRCSRASSPSHVPSDAAGA
jgi:hypothetical protein